MIQKKTGFIGTGNMGGALAAAVCKRCDPSQVLLADRSAAKAAELADRLGCRAVSNEELSRSCEYIFLGVKPQIMPDMLREIAPVLAARTDHFVLITMAAGLPAARINELTGGDYPVIRIMPNTPVAVGEGMLLFAGNALVAPEDITVFEELLSAAGVLQQLEESLINAASAVSGCGPAFVYLFIEALADGGVECGLPRATALKCAAQTVLGSAKTVLDTAKHPGQLKDEVCSPGGTTIAGVHALESGGFRSLAMDAVKTAYDKTVSLGK